MNVNIWTVSVCLLTEVTPSRWPAVNWTGELRYFFAIVQAEQGINVLPRIDALSGDVQQERCPDEDLLAQRWTIDRVQNRSYC